MTSPEHVLDFSILLHQPLVLYRIARARYADLSGAGAAVVPGRWNLRTQSAVYTGSHIGMPLLERLVHTPKEIIPSNLAMMKIQVQGDWVQTPTSLIDKHTRAYLQLCPSLESAYAHFKSTLMVVGEFGPFALAVPSVIVPAWNVVLYPQGRGFRDHVSLLSVEPFHFDHRLFPTNVTVED